MYQLSSKNKDYAINLPTDISEIDAKVLKQMTDHITVAEHYSIVAICKHVDIAQFLLANTGKKASNVLVSVVPLLAKGSNNMPVGSKIFINRTELERGEQVYINTVASENFVYGYVEGDKELFQRILTNVNKEEVYVLSFKLVPNSAIHGFVTKSYDYTKDVFYEAKARYAASIPSTGKD